MENREKRHRTLQALIATGNYTSQSSLVNAMSNAGFAVTQSSVSRDLRELEVVKVAGAYSLPATNDDKRSRGAIQRMILGVDTAGPNLVVVRTSSGAAGAVAEVIDHAKASGVVGTVAGDNTILIAVKNKAAQERVIEAIGRIR